MNLIIFVVIPSFNDYKDRSKMFFEMTRFAEKVYFILDGRVKVYREDKNGVETELAIIEKGNMFGEMALFDKGIRSASVKSIEPCKFYVFEGDKFLEVILG